MPSSFRAASLAVLALLGAFAAPPAKAVRACDADVPGHLRIQDCRLADAVAADLRRSPTLRREVDRVAELHGIVYVTTSLYALLRRRDLLGALSPQVGVSGETCVLRITLKAVEGDREVGTLAHELQHAIEVLQAPNARDEQSITALFRQIGDPIGEGLFETRAALQIESAVLRELKERRR